MKYGIMQGILGEPLSSVFESAKKIGFDGVELDWSSHEQALSGDLAPDHRAAIKGAAELAGVEIPSICAGFLNGGGIAQAEHEAEGLAVIKTGIQLCHDLGAQVLLVPFFGMAEIREQDEDRLVANLTALAPIAEAADVKLGIETARPGARMARIFETVGSPNIGSYWDMANCWSIGYDGLEDLAALSGHVIQVHAKEWTGPATQTTPGNYPGLNQDPLGKGDVPIEATVRLLNQLGYDGYIVLETGTFDNPRKSAQACLAFLKSL